jgi:hypothetical protein
VEENQLSGLKQNNSVEVNLPQRENQGLVNLPKVEIIQSTNNNILVILPQSLGYYIYNKSLW